MKINSFLISAGVITSLSVIGCTDRSYPIGFLHQTFDLATPSNAGGAAGGVDVPSALPGFYVTQETFYVSLDLGQDIVVTYNRELLPNETLESKIVQGPVEQSFALVRVSEVGITPIQYKISLTKENLAIFTSGLAQLVFTRHVGSYAIPLLPQDLRLW